MSDNGGNDRPDDATRAATSHGFSALGTGTRLDNRYTIEAVLAAGGFGITYIARHDGLGRMFAIKEHFPRQFAYRDSTTSDVRPSDPGTYKWALDRFLQEGRALARCKHPNVVDVTDVFEANRTAYMVLVYEDGQSLKNWLDTLGRKPTQAELDALVSPLLDALEFVHAQDLLHRDLAPDNIMVRRDGTPCLIDFGAARQALAQRSQVMSAIVKTGFSPPEQYTTTGRAQGPWSDIYALGATLYRAVTGRVPAESTDRQIDDELVAAGEAVADKTAYRPGFLAGIDAALVLKHAARPQSIKEMRALLMGEAGVGSVAARGVTSERLSASAVGVSVGPPVAAPSRRASLHRTPERVSLPQISTAVMTAAVVGGLALAGAGIYVWSRPSEKPSVPGALPPTSGARLASAPKNAGPAEVQTALRQENPGAGSSERLRAAEEERLRRAEVERTRQSASDAERTRQAAAAAQEAEQQRAAQRAREQLAAAPKPDTTVPNTPAELKALAPLLEKDKLRFSRLFENRAAALERSIRNAKGDAKSLAAIDAAKKLLASPSITTVPDQLVGRWRCRSISLGGSLGDDAPAFAADIGGNFECRISRDAKGLVFNKITGSMKKLARLDLLPVDGNFVLYYGTTIAQSDPQPTYPAGDAYGHEVGVLAQLSSDRLRLELSEPNHSASAGHEVIELTRIK